MTHDEIVDLAIRIGQWAERNFDTSGNQELHVILPLLGIVEELGEAEGADDDDLRDAVADAAIYALDLVYRICGRNRDAIKSLIAGVLATTRTDVVKLSTSYIVRPESGLARAFLKRIQGIRSFDDDDRFRMHVTVCLAGLFHMLSAISDSDVFELARKTFEDVVSVRDWKSHPDRGTA